MAEETAPNAKRKLHKLRLLIPVLTMILGFGSAGYMFVVVPKNKAAAAAAAATTTELQLGKIIRLAPVVTNLSDGRVLKVGLALQMVAEPKDYELNALVGVAAAEAAGESAKPSETVTTTLYGLEAKALDVAIAELGNSTFDTLSAPGGRTAAKIRLVEKIKEAYQGDVENVYFTDFVMS